MPLTDVRIRALKPGDKPFKKADAGGLYLLITAAKTNPETGVTTGGAKLWRLNYKYGGKRLTLAFGAYPTVGLAEARDQRDDAKKLLADNKEKLVAVAKGLLERETLDTGEVKSLMGGHVLAPVLAPV